MQRKIGTIARGIKCPIIREGDNVVDISIENAINLVDDRIYGYGGAFNRCFTFSIVQIIFIIVYIL